MFEPEELMARIVDLEAQLKVSEMAPPAAEQLIACLEGEIAKRDEELAACRVAVENCEVFRARIAEIEADRDSHQRCAIQAMAELAALKAQEPVAAVKHGPLDSDGWPEFVRVETIGDFDLENLPSGMKLYAAPVSEAKAQGEYGDAYQGAREDLAIWKRRALEAEKALQEERIITELLGNALNKENGPTFMGEPVFPAKAQGVVMPEHETSTPSSKWSSAGEPDPHGKAYDCERAELSMGEYTDDELANAVFMHDHRSFDIVATMRGEPGSIVLLTAAKDRIRWLSRSLDKALARLNASPAAPAADASDVLEQAMYTLISIGYHENSGLVHELRQALAAHCAKGVV